MELIYKAFKMKIYPSAFTELKKISIDEKVGIGRMIGLILENFVADYKKKVE